MKAQTVLVTDGEQRASLAIVRSLGRVGHTVHVCSARDRSLAGVSRYATSHTTVPDPLAGPGEYVEALRRLIHHHGIDILIPVTEPSLIAVLERPERVADALLPFPDRDRFERASDKAFVTHLAEAIGIRVPHQQVLSCPEDLGRSPRPTDLVFPLVLKPSRSIAGSGAARHKTAVAHIADADALRRSLAALPIEAYPVLLQERVIGEGVGAFLLRWDGEVLASFCHRRLREKPPSGGVSVYRESVAPDRSLLARSAALLDALDWQGVAMVEYKMDAKTGAPYLMEINGRFWGSLQLAIDAGVDFPSLLVAAATGQSPAPASDYKVGVHSRWFWGDVDYLLARLRYSREQLSLLPEAPSRTRALLDFVVSSLRPRGRGEILRLYDPAPALRESLDWITRR